MGNVGEEHLHTLGDIDGRHWWMDNSYLSQFVAVRSDYLLLR
jgi:hypothetical protein